MENDNEHKTQDDNFEILLKKICSELKKKDKHKNGLTLYNSFVDVMDMFQIEYDGPIMNYLMNYCTVTEDGFVNYKRLLLIHDPSKTIKNNSEYIEETFNPKSIYLQDKYKNNDNLTQTKNEIIRKLYSLWDKCFLTDKEFKDRLINENVEITEEFERCLYLYGPSKSLSFAAVMKSLYINDSTNRKNRNNFVNKIKDEAWCKLNISENTPQQFQDVSINPITWIGTTVVNNDLNILVQNIEEISNYLIGKENINTETAISKQIFNTTIKNLVKCYISSKISEREFYFYLNKLYITLTPELNTLVKQHESDNNGSFRAFIITISRATPPDVLKCLQ